MLTIASNFAIRRLDEVKYPVTAAQISTVPGVKILVHSQHPEQPTLGHIVMIHGLEGSSDAGYMRSMAQCALAAGYSVHRTNMRSCGGTEALAETMYHAGLTVDTLRFLEGLRSETPLPIFLIGYSLGGNVALKLTGELGAGGRSLIAGTCAVSTPIDLAACVEQMSQRQNRIYEWRFLSRLKQRIRRRSVASPGRYPLHLLDRCRTVYQFDDWITAPQFAFGSAEKYYETQSARNFLPDIQVPTLLVQALDDPLIPFDVFRHSAITENSSIQLLAVPHGGHLGFISNRAPRFWLDGVLLRWIQRHTIASPLA